jgi:hypothetical protein
MQRIKKIGLPMLMLLQSQLHCDCWGNNGVIEDYNFESIMDTSKEYTFTLVDSPDVNINNFFNINNKTFMPISLERIISIKESKTVTGRFYAMLLSQ